MEINFPSEVKSNLFGYQSLINIFNKCHRLENQKIFFNFTCVTFFEANLCALLGVIIEVVTKNNNSYTFIGVHHKILEVWDKNGFSNRYFDRPIMKDLYGTTVAYKTFEDTASEESFIEYVQIELLDKPNFPKLTETLSSRILGNIFETFVNAVTHGKCQFVHTCGQFFPNRGNKPLNFSVIDLGKNIKENVNEYFNNNMSASEAILWAMERTNTTKKDVPGGLGLSEIFQFIQLNKGKVEIVSSNGYYRLLNNHVESILLPEEFPGTIVNFMFNLSDNKSYSLK